MFWDGLAYVVLVVAFQQVMHDVERQSIVVEVQREILIVKSPSLWMLVRICDYLVTFLSMLCM